MSQVLVIDDEQIVLQSVGRVLEEQGYQVDSVREGRKGLDWATSRDYDVVLTDLKMPDIGGMRVLERIRREKPTLPVIMITGYATSKSARECLQLGASNYLEKPLRPDLLEDAVARALMTSERKPSVSRSKRAEVIRALERATKDNGFGSALLYEGSKALGHYNLTTQEKAAIACGDVVWLEKHIGRLTSTQKQWLNQRLAAEIW